MPIYFHTEDISFRLKKPSNLKSWVKRVILSEKRKPETINFIFCDDEFLLGLNKKYLKHNSYTDIITFDNSSDPETIAGDIFISIERVKDNAQKLKVDFKEELHRVMIHGVLHLLGYNDKKTVERNTMRKKEDQYLKMVPISISTDHQ